jgi:hypothetical protein
MEEMGQGESRLLFAKKNLSIGCVGEQFYRVVSQ